MQQLVTTPLQGPQNALHEHLRACIADGAWHWRGELLAKSNDVDGMNALIVDYLKNGLLISDPKLPQHHFYASEQLLGG